jgi:putative flippase GtrA
MKGSEVIQAQLSGKQFPVVSCQRFAILRRRQSLIRWLKFNLVGGIGVAVQLAALGVFRSWLGLDYLVATGFAVEIAVIHNFLWHERFTWLDRRAVGSRQSLARFVKFNLSNGAVSLAGNLLLMRALVGAFGFNYVAANVVAIVLCSLVNFLLGDRFVFDGPVRCVERRGA